MAEIMIQIGSVGSSTPLRVEATLFPGGLAVHKVPTKKGEKWSPARYGYAVTQICVGSSLRSGFSSKAKAATFTEQLLKEWPDWTTVLKPAQLKERWPAVRQLWEALRKV